MRGVRAHRLSAQRSKNGLQTMCLAAIPPRSPDLLRQADDNRVNVAIRLAVDLPN